MYDIRVGDIVRAQGDRSVSPIREGVVVEPAEYAPELIRIRAADGIVYIYEPRNILDRLENGYRVSIRKARS